MSPSRTSPLPVVTGAPLLDPLAPITQLVHGAATLTLHVILGLLLGLLAVHVMRRCHLHWSWAAGSCALAFCARAPLGASAPALLTGTLLATTRGRRWHREDLEAGMDLAATARKRRHLLDALRAITRSASARLSDTDIAVPLVRRCAELGSRPRSAGRSRWFNGNELVLGTDDRGRSVSVALGGAGGGSHTLVVGATGSGKTVTQTWIAKQAIAHGMGAVLVDPKGDRALREAARRAAHEADRDFIEWTPRGPAVYNPCARGSDTEIADRVLASERYTEPHYQRQAQRYLGHATRVLRGAGQQVSLAKLVRLLDPAALEVLARELSAANAEAVHDYLDSLTPRQCSDLTGVRDRLAIIAESDVGPWLNPEAAGGESFDLLAALRQRAVVYFGLEADSRPLLAQMLGGAIVLDLQTAISSLQAGPVPTLVMIDEFSAIAAGHIARLFGRARSAGVSLLLGTQELSDLRLPGSEHLLEQVLGNLTTLVAHRQVVPDSAELIARLSGTRGVWSTSWHRDGRATRKRAHEHCITAQDVTGLARGHAAVIGLVGGADAALTRVLPPGARL